MELVKTKQADIARYLLSQFEHGVRLALVFFQVAVNLLHEGMEVQTLLATVRHRIIKAVHQETFATADTAPEIDALRRSGWRQKTLEGTAAVDLERKQIPVKILQGQCSRHLRSIGNIATRIQQIFIGVEHALRGDVQFFMGHRGC